MDKNLLKKSLPVGLLLGIGSALAVAGLRLLLKGGTFFDHLFSLYGILTFVCVPAAWVAHACDRNKNKGSE